MPEACIEPDGIDEVNTNKTETYMGGMVTA